MHLRSSPAGAAYVPGLFSVVIPTRNEGAMLEMTTESVLATTAWPLLEVVVVDDGSTDDSTVGYLRRPDRRVRVLRGGGLGVAQARNLGARHARGEYVAFLDAHCRVSADWLDRFAVALADPGVALVGPTFTRLDAPEPRGCGMFWADARLDQHWFEPLAVDAAYDVPLTTGACQALRRDVFDAVGRYDPGFTCWGFEDVELCLRCWSFGLRVVADPIAVVAHHFRESRGYDVDDEDITYNFVRMVALHFDEPELSATLAALGDNPHLPAAIARVEADGTAALRQAYGSLRVHGSGWFFAQVNGIPVLDG